MNVEVTFFLANGNEIGHVETQYTSVEDAVDYLQAILGTKTTYKASEDIVISMMHVTHFIAKEHDGGVDDEQLPEVDEANLPEVMKINGRSIRAVYDMDTPEFTKFIGDDIPKTHQEVSILALKWGMPNANLLTLLNRHGLIDDL